MLCRISLYDPFSMQRSVDNSKPPVDPFFFLVSSRRGRVVCRPNSKYWRSLCCSGVGHLPALGVEVTAFAQEDADSTVDKNEVFQDSSTGDWRDYTFLHSVRCLTVDARNIQDFSFVKTKDPLRGEHHCY